MSAEIIPPCRMTTLFDRPCGTSGIWLPARSPPCRPSCCPRAGRSPRGSERYVCRLAEPGARQPVEAGLLAAERLRVRGIAVGEPVRTLGGAPHRARPRPARWPCCAGCPAGRWTGATRSTSSGGATGWAPCTGPCSVSTIPACARGSRSTRRRRIWPREPWLRAAVADAVGAATRLTVTDRLTYGVLHGDPAPDAASSSTPAPAGPACSTAAPAGSGRWSTTWPRRCSTSAARAAPPN